MSTVVTRRLSTRRGSISAPDPYAKNAHLTRESSSILTIVKVTTPPVATPSPPTGPPERPPSPRRVHRRMGSNPSSPLPSPAPVDPPPGRLSFAFSSFGAPHQQSSSSGPGSPRARPASPHRTTSAPAFSQQRLSPEQLLEVVKQATNPRYIPSSPAVTPAAASHSPILHPRSSSPQQPSSGTVAPATFTPLPPDVYLPFLDRPAEVKALLSSPPSAKLFALLAQTFPKNVPPRESDDLPLNTADWTFEDLSHWLNETTRDEASDSFWVQTARRCILKHSELIWERLKGALGVPPELDVEYTEAEYHDVFESDSESEGVLETAKKSPEDSEDLGATADSPVDHKAAESSPGASRHVTFPPELSRTSTSSSTPTIFTQMPTPHHDETYFTFSPHELTPSVSGVIIEPVIASSESVMSPNPPPLSLPASLSGDAAGLGDIGEEDEEEGATPPVETQAVESEVPQVHGLRISTPASPMLPYPPSLRSATTGAPLRSPSFSARSSSRPHSPTFVRSGSSSSLHRSGSFGSVRSVSSLDVPYDPVADRAPWQPDIPEQLRETRARADACCQQSCAALPDAAAAVQLQLGCEPLVLDALNGSREPLPTQLGPRVRLRRDLRQR
ncbi:hypothetical protein MSAN_00738500 [Mycena sanguinolenta]|uniref:Uncharacterized protein n=1 Tax=Mycena sanguinolenta TaxID=230812 RepID=A0A8H6Z1S2_9AGAR|nr:hypothetical protein MSAN_00738500 [Mycena sanguinolenta]